jgi:hypothetical protein
MLLPLGVLVAIDRSPALGLPLGKALPLGVLVVLSNSPKLGLPLGKALPDGTRLVSTALGEAFGSITFDDGSVLGKMLPESIGAPLGDVLPEGDDVFAATGVMFEGAPVIRIADTGATVVGAPVFAGTSMVKFIVGLLGWSLGITLGKDVSDGGVATESCSLEEPVGS